MGQRGSTLRYEYFLGSRIILPSTQVPYGHWTDAEAVDVVGEDDPNAIEEIRMPGDRRGWNRQRQEATYTWRLYFSTILVTVFALRMVKGWSRTLSKGAVE